MYAARSTHKGGRGGELRPARSVTVRLTRCRIIEKLSEGLIQTESAAAVTSPIYDPARRRTESCRRGRRERNLSPPVVRLMRGFLSRIDRGTDESSPAVEKAKALTQRLRTDLHCGRSPRRGNVQRRREASFIPRHFKADRRRFLSACVIPPVRLLPSGGMALFRVSSTAEASDGRPSL